MDYKQFIHTSKAGWQAGRLKVEEVMEGASAGSKGRMRHKCRDFKQSIQINQMPATVTATT